MVSGNVQCCSAGWASSPILSLCSVCRVLTVICLLFNVSPFLAGSSPLSTCKLQHLYSIVSKASERYASYANLFFRIFGFSERYEGSLDNQFRRGLYPINHSFYLLFDSLRINGGDISYLLSLLSFSILSWSSILFYVREGWGGQENGFLSTICLTVSQSSSSITISLFPSSLILFLLSPSLIVFLLSPSHTSNGHHAKTLS